MREWTWVGGDEIEFSGRSGIFLAEMFYTSTVAYTITSNMHQALGPVFTCDSAREMRRIGERRECENPFQFGTSSRCCWRFPRGDFDGTVPDSIKVGRRGEEVGGGGRRKKGKWKMRTYFHSC